MNAAILSAQISKSAAHLRSSDWKLLVSSRHCQEIVHCEIWSKKNQEIRTLNSTNTLPMQLLLVAILAVADNTAIVQYEMMLQHSNISVEFKHKTEL